MTRAGGGCGAGFLDLWSLGLLDLEPFCVRPLTFESNSISSSNEAIESLKKSYLERTCVIKVGDAGASIESILSAFYKV